MKSSSEPAFETQSIWLANAPQTQYPQLEHLESCDVAVIGGGITGLTTALLLQRDGRRVVLIEAERIGCGITGHTTAKLTSLHTLIYARLTEQFGPEAAHDYAEANQAGLRLIRTLVRDLGIDCNLESQAAITYTCQDQYVDQVRAEADEAARAGLDASFTSEVDLPLPIKGAVRVEDQAQFHPYPYCKALATEFIRAGGKVFENTRAIDVEHANECKVTTEQGEVRASQVVLATLIPVFDPGAFFARVFPSRTYGIAVSLKQGERAPEGMSISVEQPTRSVRPLADRRGIIVVGETHKVGQDADTRERYSALENWARDHFPIQSVDYRWSAQDFMAADGLPYIGRMPLAGENVFLATGFNKWGLTTGSFAAIMLADLVEGRENMWSQLFDPARANLTASANKLIAENANVAKHYVGDWIKSLSAPTLEELPSGTGAIVDRNGEKIAAYRDETGKVYTVSPICTHMGCYVQWNTAEKSWDCPCHGSRFDFEGRVLQSPAVKPLDTID